MPANKGRPPEGPRGPSPEASAIMAGVHMLDRFAVTAAACRELQLALHVVSVIQAEGCTAKAAKLLGPEYEYVFGAKGGSAMAALAWGRAKRALAASIELVGPVQVPLREPTPFVFEGRGYFADVQAFVMQRFEHFFGAALPDPEAIARFCRWAKGDLEEAGVPVPDDLSIEPAEDDVKNGHPLGLRYRVMVAVSGDQVERYNRLLSERG